MKLLLHMFWDILCNIGMITFLINGELNYMIILSRCCCISIYMVISRHFGDISEHRVCLIPLFVMKIS